MIKELEDYDWFPSWLRRYQLDFIGAMVAWIHVYKPLIVVINDILIKYNQKSVVDICSGSGLPAVYIHQHCSNINHTLLTDKYPHSKVNITGVSYAPTSIDVLNLEVTNSPVYTMYNAFHHFTDAQQVQIVQKFSEQKCNFLIVEMLSPGIISLVQVVIASTIGQLLFTPFIKPFSLGRILFTYIIPLNIFTVLIDGIISVFKSKSVKQYKTLLQKISVENFTIEVKTIKQLNGNIIYIQGTNN